MLYIYCIIRAIPTSSTPTLSWDVNIPEPQNCEISKHMGVSRLLMLLSLSNPRTRNEECLSLFPWNRFDKHCPLVFVLFCFVSLGHCLCLLACVVSPLVFSSPIKLAAARELSPNLQLSFASRSPRMFVGGPAFLAYERCIVVFFHLFSSPKTFVLRVVDFRFVYDAFVTVCRVTV